MISDTLSDAAAEIQNYQRDYPNAYDSMRDAIDRVVAAMKQLQAMLDTPPKSPAEANPADAAKEVARMVLLADYRRDVQDVAKRVKAAIDSGEIPPHAFTAYLNDSVAESVRVTNKEQAMECLLVSDAAELSWEFEAFHAFRFNVRRELNEMGVDFDAADKAETQGN